MRVRATKTVYYGDTRHVPGTRSEVFEIKDEPTRPLRKTDNEVTRKLAVKNQVPRDWSQSSMAPVEKMDLRGTVFDAGEGAKEDKKATGEQEKI